MRVTPRPPPRVPPPDPFAPEEAAHLTARHLTAPRLGGGRQGIECPLWRAVWVGRGQRARPFVRGLARWGQLAQAQNGAALLLREPQLAAGTGLPAKPLDSLVVEGLPPFADRFQVAAEHSRDLARPLPIPAVGAHLGVQNPVRRRMTAVGAFAHLALLAGIQWWAGGKMLGQGTPPWPCSPAYVTSLLRNDALGERERRLLWPPIRVGRDV
jgi:hypothetical protein